MELRQRISQRVRNLARVGSRETAARIEAARGQGVEMLELLGAPLSLPGQNVIEAASRAAQDYCRAPSQGLLELREAIASKLQREQGFTADPREEILVTAGAMQGLNALFATILDPGDEVLATRPGFFFHGIAELCLGSCRGMPTEEESGFAYDRERLEASLSERTRAIILVNPNNPSGHLATKAELEMIAEVAIQHDLLVISDDSYERMVYDGRRHISFASLPGLRDRTITVQSFTKSYAMPGWRVGYLVAPAPLLTHILKVHEWLLLCCGYVEQKAAAAAMDGPQDWVKEIATHFQQCRDALCAELQDIPCAPPQGGPFLFLNVGRHDKDSRSFSRRLIDEQGIPNEPGEVFGSPGYVRIPFGARDAGVAREAGRRLRKALTSAEESRR